MGLNDIQLNAHLLTTLYPHSLIEPEPALYTNREEPAEQTTEILPKENAARQGVALLGGNRRNITLVVRTAAPSLPEGALSFLNSILAACKLSLDDVALVNLHPHPYTFAQLQESLHGKQMILFGLTPLDLDLPLNFPPFQLQPFGGCTYLAAPALQELEQDKALKSKLWTCLKSLFGL